jgi:SAM-dependent methyltransferase
MKQSEIMKLGEADAWFNRNRDKLGLLDPVTDLIAGNKITPRSVLEVGCANGWRLERLREQFGCNVLGIDPSAEACISALGLHDVPVLRGTARSLLSGVGDYDMIIYGFCLYVTDPEDWFYIAAEADRALQSNGYLIIHDFAAPSRPFTRPYKHRAGLLSYHFDFARLWLTHPAYVLVARAIDGDTMVTILRKVTSSAFEART